MESKQLNEENDDLTLDPVDKTVDPVDKTIDPVDKTIDPDDKAIDPVDRLLQEEKPASSGKGVALLALLLALVAVSVSGWQWWQTYLEDSGDEASEVTQSLALLQSAQEQLGGSLASIEKRLEAVTSSIDAAQSANRENRLETAENRLGALQKQTAEYKASISALQGGVRSLERRLAATESGLISVAASSQNSSEELDIAEIDFMLRVASERVQLFADPSAAELALQAADLQIEALNDPMFLSVRQQIASARQALAAVPRPDRVQLSTRFTNLQSKVPLLPFRGEVQVQSQSQAELAEDAGWWQSFKHTLSSLVTVRRRVPEDRDILSLDDKDYLRQGLWLQFETARLATMRNDSSVFNASLSRAEETIEQFFETGSSVVQSLLQEIKTLEQVDIAPQMPDISGPWAQLRQLRESRRLLQTATPVEPAPVENEDSGK